MNIIFYSSDDALCEDLKSHLSSEFNVNYINKELEKTEFNIINPDFYIIEDNKNKSFEFYLNYVLNLRSFNSNLIIIFISDKKDLYAQMASYESGCNDYLVKPVYLPILIKKILSFKTILNNQKSKEINKFIYKNLEIDKYKREVKKSGKIIDLPKKQFDLCVTIFSNPNQVLTRDNLFQKIWNKKLSKSNRTLDVHINAIRNKIGSNFIKTIKGIGFKAN